MTFHLCVFLTDSHSLSLVIATFPSCSEMYGYSYGAAKAGVWHKWDTHAMLYPGYLPSPHPPRILHYGLTISVQHTGGEWAWSKQTARAFNVRECPPWNFEGERAQQHGLFYPFPPHPKDLVAQVQHSGWGLGFGVYYSF